MSERKYKKLFARYRPIWKAFENIGWNIRRYDNTVELENYSPAGEDLVETLYLDEKENIVRQLYDIYDNFDEEEHIAMWLEAKRSGKQGIPCVWTLVKDAEEITEMYKQLFCLAQENYELCKGGKLNV